MGTIATVEKRLNTFSKWLRRNLVTFGEYKNIKRKKSQWRKIELSVEQDKEIKDYYRAYYGKPIKTYWHRLYQSYLGVYHKNYFPEILLSTKLEPLLNPYRIAEFLGDKNLISQFFHNIEDLHIPKTYLSCSNGIFRNDNYELLSVKEATKAIANIGSCIIKKTLDTSSGRDVQLCNIKNGIDSIKGEKLENILKSFGNHFVIQELIEQNERLKILNPTSVNTFRVMSYFCHNELYVCPIALRLGRSNADRDNIHYGGIVVGVNADDTLKPTAFSEYGEGFDCHPDTGVKFEGYSIGEGKVDALINMAKLLHARMPYLGILSWDFTIDKEGKIVIIEVNTTGQSAWFCQMVNGEPLFGDNTPQILNLIKNR